MEENALACKAFLELLLMSYDSVQGSSPIDSQIQGISEKQ